MFSFLLGYPLFFLLHSLYCVHLFLLQLPEAFQGHENQGSALMVPTDPQRPSLPAHQSSAHHPQGPEMRQHLHHGAHGLGEDRRPGLGHTEEGVFC